MSHNLAKRSQLERDKANVELAAAAVVYKERYGMPVSADNIVKMQPESLQAWFLQCLVDYRKISSQFSNLPYQPLKK